MDLTQDCNDSAYGDHVGTGKNAWDFANGTQFFISAAREGVVTHLKMSSNAGCDSPACVDYANYIVVDHGDGTASVYLHVAAGSLDSAVRCGQSVRQGQKLATAGSTGWSTGPHLHFQVNQVHTGDAHACECGEDGSQCAPDESAWSSFWSSPRFPSVPIVFDEWAASACGDRRMILPVSTNVDEPDRRLVTIGRFGAGSWPNRPAVVLGVGGRRGRSFSGKSRLPLSEILPPSPPAPTSSPAHPHPLP
jgi:murein DD-endopeptidase MepM/ murein hydrolase activator NlpD